MAFASASDLDVPSPNDIGQIVRLTSTLAADGCPAVMLIIGDPDARLGFGELGSLGSPAVSTDPGGSAPRTQGAADAAMAAAIEETAPRDFLGGEKLEDGIGLCLSGGGFRAMLFHVGAFVRLNELGILSRLDRVASVSGGSIAAGALAAGWTELHFDQNGVATNLLDVVIAPLLELSRKRVDVPAILLGLLPFVSAADRVAAVYDRALFHGKTLLDLPRRPRFSFTATSLQTGTLWRFARDYAADWRIGSWPLPRITLAAVVSASAAFPPYLSPAYIRAPTGAIVSMPGADLCRAPFVRRLCLTDGGIYDNLGLEPVWKRYRTVLVSDGGAVVPPAGSPRSNWLSLSMRVADIALQQGINMRRRVLRGLNNTSERTVVYWAISEGVESYGTGNPLAFPATESRLAAEVRTRLTRYPLQTRDRIIRAGYAHCDAAIRASRFQSPIGPGPRWEGVPKPT